MASNFKSLETLNLRKYNDQPSIKCLYLPYSLFPAFQIVLKDYTTNSSAFTHSSTITCSQKSLLLLGRLTRTETSCTYQLRSLPCCHQWGCSCVADMRTRWTPVAVMTVLSRLWSAGVASGQTTPEGVPHSTGNWGKEMVMCKAPQ